MEMAEGDMLVVCLGKRQVVHDLVGIKQDNSQPEEHMIECVCELLQAIGYTLDAAWRACLFGCKFSLGTCCGALCLLGSTD